MSVKRGKWVSEKLLVPYGENSQMRLDFQRYELKQGVNLDIITESTEPNLIGAEQTVYWQRDRVQEGSRGFRVSLWSLFFTKTRTILLGNKISKKEEKRKSLHSMGCFFWHYLRR